MLIRAHLWTVSLAVAFAASLAWVLLPGDCVVVPAGAESRFLARSILGTIVHPFAVDWVYLLNMTLKLTPIGIVALAFLHWTQRFDKLRAATALFAMILAAAVTFHPYRSFSDTHLIIIVSIWGIIVMVAHSSKASPGSALLALMSMQIVMSELYSGLGVDRGLPFWLMLMSQSIVFSYGLFHYTRMLRHSVLGRFTVIRPLDPGALAHRKQLAEQRRKLEEQEPPAPLPG